MPLENGYENFGHESSILDMKKYNGRVSIMDEEDVELRFKMFERIAIKNKATEYRDPLSGMLENTILSKVFFSAGNEQIIQNGIRAGVFNASNEKYVISQQNSDQLKIIMRSIYLQYSMHKKGNVTSQVEVINKRVLDYCIDYVYQEAVSYEKYLRDQSTLIVPLERSMQPDRDFKQLQNRIGI